MAESMTSFPSAAILVIGNEILTGRTQDRNISILAERLSGIGVRLSEARIIRDKSSSIVDAVRTLSANHDYLFTSGGIGPTHDDITTDSIALAFDTLVEQHPGAVDMLKSYYGSAELTEIRLRMARIPCGAHLIPNAVSGAPGYQISNVYVMAGVPRIFASMLAHVMPTLQAGSPLMALGVYGVIAESVIADDLAHLDTMHSDVEIGSYPSMRAHFSAVQVVVRGVDNDKVREVAEAVQAIMRAKGVEPGNIEESL